LVTGQLPVGRFESPSELRAEMSAAVAEALDSLLLDLLSRNPDERPDAEAALTRFRAIEGPCLEPSFKTPPAVDSFHVEEQVDEHGMVMVRIRPGTFTMGSAGDDPQAYDAERPGHEVTLSEFWIGKTQVTNEQYRKLRPDHDPGAGADLPVTKVSWHDAKAFCEFAGYDLPTEAEWEYAARADTQTPWSFGANEEDIGRFAWYAGNSGDQPHPVGTRESNPWDLHDMHGNVWEWIADWFGPYSEDAQIDPEGPSSGAWRVLRGGSSWCGPGGLRSALRYGNRPEYRDRNIGFRCVRRPRRQP
ncbi:MAG: formylglycine-generating enzyme family protein, partial [bacterium]|nr:formylglycine-generating enzyme family protein [bacterium]